MILIPENLGGIGLDGAISKGQEPFHATARRHRGGAAKRNTELDYGFTRDGATKLVAPPVATKTAGRAIT